MVNSLCTILSNHVWVKNGLSVLYTLRETKICDLHPYARSGTFPSFSYGFDRKIWGKHLLRILSRIETHLFFLSHLSMYIPVHLLRVQYGAYNLPFSVVLDRREDKNCETGRYELAFKQVPFCMIVLLNNIFVFQVISQVKH